MNIHKLIGVKMPEAVNDNTKIPYDLSVEVPVFDINTDVSDIIQKVLKFGAVIVNKNDKFFGIVDKKSIKRVELNIPKNETLERFVVKVPKINSRNDVGLVATYFYRNHVIALPYENEGKIDHILDRKTFFKILLSLQDLKNADIKKIMSSPLTLIDSDSNLSKLKETLDNNNIDTVGVLYNSKFYGIITTDTVLENIVTKERSPGIEDEKYSPSNIIIKDYTNTNPITISEDKPLYEAVDLMVVHDNSPIVVTKENEPDEPVGLITSTDILEYITSVNKHSTARVFVSGLDKSSYIYEDEIKEDIKNFLCKINKITDIGVDYISVSIKKIKTSQYNVRFRLITDKYGAIQVNYSDYLLDRTIEEGIKKLDTIVMKYKSREE